MIRLLEARTHSPSPQGPGETSLLGWFEEFVLPVADMKRAEAEWERLGFVPAEEGDEPYPHIGLTSDSLNVALLPSGVLRRPALMFADADTPARIAKLKEAGFEFARRLPGNLDADAACAARRAGRHATAADDDGMKRATLAILFLLAAPAAGAWVPCEQKDITPPRPIQREAPPYPQAVRELGIEGTVEVALTVLRDGSVGWVRIVRADPRGYFEQAASEGVRRWRFSPAMQDGQPIECRLRTRVRFALTDAAATVEGLSSGDRPQPDLSARAPAGAHRGLRRGRVRPRCRRRRQERETLRRNAARRVREGGARGRARLARAGKQRGAAP